MPRTYSRPHYAQARTWYRFACWLRRASCPQFNPHLAKEDALRESFRLRSRSVVFPSRLQDCTAAGLARLAKRAEAGDTYPELVARVAQVDPDDPTADEVHLFLEVADRTGTHTEKHLLGKLPPEDALWVAPLIRLETDASRLRPAKSEVTRLWAYNKKAKDLLGWAPEVSLDEGLDRTIAYIKDHLDDYDPDRYAV